jgi:hypothetical protein
MKPRGIVVNDHLSDRSAGSMCPTNSEPSIRYGGLARAISRTEHDQLAYRYCGVPQIVRDVVSRVMCKSDRDGKVLAEPEFDPVKERRGGRGGWDVTSPLNISLI